MHPSTQNLRLADWIICEKILPSFLWSSFLVRRRPMSTTVAFHWLYIAVYIVRYLSRSSLGHVFFSLGDKDSDDQCLGFFAMPADCGDLVLLTRGEQHTKSAGAAIQVGSCCMRHSCGLDHLLLRGTLPLSLLDFRVPLIACLLSPS